MIRNEVDNWVEQELLEAEAASDALDDLMRLHPPRDLHESAWDLSQTLKQTARSLRLALVAEAEPKVISRLRLRLQMGIGQAWTLVDSRALAPPSQRPTMPPSLGMSAEEVWAQRPASDHPPQATREASNRHALRASSGIVAHVGASSAAARKRTA